MFRRLLILPVLALWVAGCSRGPYDIAQVSGQITLNGKPLANAAILFNPIAAPGNDNPGPGSTGITDEEGRYTLKLTRLDQARGAVVGRHQVRFADHDPTPQDPSDDAPKPKKKKSAIRVPSKYNQLKPLFEYDVPARGTKSADFNLTSP